MPEAFQKNVFGHFGRLQRPEVDDLIEVRPAVGAILSLHPFVTFAWARKWPCEEVWKARKTQI